MDEVCQPAVGRYCPPLRSGQTFNGNVGAERRMIKRVIFIALAVFGFVVAVFIAVDNFRTMADGIAVSATNHFEAVAFLIGSAICVGIAWFAKPMKAQTKENGPNQQHQPIAGKPGSG